MQLHPKKSKIVSETCAKWLQFGAVSETRGLAFYLGWFYVSVTGIESISNGCLFTFAYIGLKRAMNCWELDAVTGGPVTHPTKS